MANENDDLLNPDEIEKLLSGAGQGESASGDEQSPPGESAGADSGDAESSTEGETGDLLDASDIESLLKQQGASASGPPKADQATSASADETANKTEALLDKAEADLAAAVATDLEPSLTIPPELGSPKPFDFKEFPGKKGGALQDFGMTSLQDVELDLRIELGRTELLIQEVLDLKEGSVVPLDKLAGDPVDILVNGRLIARGEVLVLNDNFCVRVAEILTPHF